MTVAPRCDGRSCDELATSLRRSARPAPHARRVRKVALCGGCAVWRGDRVWGERPGARRSRARPVRTAQALALLPARTDAIQVPMDQCAHSPALAPWQDEQLARDAAPSRAAGRREPQASPLLARRWLCVIVVMEMRGYDTSRWSPRVCGAPRPAWRVACGTPFEQQPGGCPASLFMRHVCVGLPSWAWWLGGTTWFQVAAARPPSTGQSASSLMVAPEPDFGSDIGSKLKLISGQ